MAKKNKYGIDLVSIRLVKDRKLYSENILNSPESVVREFSEYLRDFDKEVCAVINLQTDLKPININIFAMGSVNNALITPAELFKSSILSNAASIIVLHNHPSGNVVPSKADINVTNKIKNCCDLLGISFLDHIIVGKGQCYSMQHEGCFNDLKVAEQMCEHQISYFSKNESSYDKSAECIIENLDNEFPIGTVVKLDYINSFTGPDKNILGVVSDIGKDGMVKVEWENGCITECRYGKDFRCHVVGKKYSTGINR